MGSTPRIDRLDKNIIINGAMEFWQRVVGTTTTVNTASSQAVYTADRMSFATQGPTVKNFRVLRDVDSPNSMFPYSYKFECLTAIASPNSIDLIRPLVQKIEGVFYKQVYGKPISVGFWIKITAPSATFPIQIPVDFKNHDSTRHYATTVEVMQNSTWQFVTVSLNAESSGAWLLDTGIGLFVQIGTVAGSSFVSASSDQWSNGEGYAVAGSFNIMNNSANIMQVTGLRLIETTTDKKDLSPDVFIRAGRDYADELQLCQRYYQKTFFENVAPGFSMGANGSLQTLAHSVNIIQTTWHFPVILRTSSFLVTLYSPFEANTNWINNPGPTTSSTVFFNSRNVTVRGTGNIGEGNSSGIHVTVDAEL
jgi:hypothetical protein